VFDCLLERKKLTLLLNDENFLFLRDQKIFFLVFHILRFCRFLTIFIILHPFIPMKSTYSSYYYSVSKDEKQF
jgi:hypothetical protein